jgi:uncharacterized protein (TIGR02266 family)
VSVARRGPAGPRAAPVETVARILLVDDARRLIELLKHYLKRTSCRVLTARSGAEALDSCRRERPDLIFLDETMRDRDGLAVCRELKGDPLLRQIPVVIVASRDRAEACREAGCDDVLPKPVVQAEFLARVRRFVALLERVEDRIPVSLKVEFQALTGSYTAYTKDLSPRGLFLKSPRAFAPGTRLRIAIHLPHRAEPLRLEAVVRRVVEPVPGSHLLPGVGLQFGDAPPEVIQILSEFIAERRSR